MGISLNFARSPSLLSLPNRKTRSQSHSRPRTLKSAQANGTLMILSQGGSFSEDYALRRLESLHASVPRLMITYDYSGSSCKVPSHHSSRSRCTYRRPLKKLSQSGLKILNENGRLLNLSRQKLGSVYKTRSQKDPARCVEWSSSHTYDNGRVCDATRPSVGADCDESLGEYCPNASALREVAEPCGDWWPYGAGSVGVASVVASVMGMESNNALASAAHGGGNGQQPPAGFGGGGGGGDNGGFEAGTNGESFFGDLIYGPGRNREEEQRRTVSTHRRIPNRPPARSIASLSSVAVDLTGGETPIDGREGSMSRGFEAAHRISNQGSYLAAKPPLNRVAEEPSGTIARNYDPPDPFSAGGDGLAQDRPTSSLERSENNVQDSPGRDTAFSMGISARFNPTSIYIPSGEPPEHRYARGNELNNASFRGRNDYYSHARDLHQVPPEFSSIRGKITEIPGYAEEGEGNKDLQITDFSGWVGGLVNSILGKRTSGTDLRTEKKALVSEVANRTLQIINDQTTGIGLAKSSEIGALRRLLREAFSDLLKIRERLDKLEHQTGARRGKSTGNPWAGAKTTLKGEVNAGGAFVLLDDLTTDLSRFSLQHAGMRTGLDVRFIFETSVRENDLLTTQCSVGQPLQPSGEIDTTNFGGPITLQKISYVAKINDALSLVVAPLGAKPTDMADTINHLQGQALTTFSGSGPALYQHCKGSAIGASLRSSSMLLSMSQFLSGWGSRAFDTTTATNSFGPLCLSSLAQIMIQPCEHMVFSMSAVNNFWPSPPLPSVRRIHWSEMGPLVLCKTLTRPTQTTGTFTFNDLPSSSSASFMSQVHIPEQDNWSPDAESRGPLGIYGTSMQSVAFSGQVNLGGHISIGGWAQVEWSDWLQELERKDFEWNLSLAKSSGPNVHWGLSIGQRKCDDWEEYGSCSPTSGPLEPSSFQLQMEAFVKLKAGTGFSLQPGLVCVLDKDTKTPAFMLRSSWTL